MHGRKQLVLVSGLGGAGKTTAARALEDIGFFVVDNLPPQLIDPLLKLTDTSGGEILRFALVIDARESQFLADFLPAWTQLRTQQHDVTLLFFDCDDEVLIRRYKETRRKHPLDDGDGIRSGVAKERVLLRDVRAVATEVVDTSELSPHDLKRRVTARFSTTDARRQRVAVMSFGFKHGLPSEIDVCFDARFLQNPYFIQELRPQSGLDDAVRDFVLRADGATEFLRRTTDLLLFLLPKFAAEGKSYITIGIGCTGGQHRSVAITEAFASILREHAVDVRVSHRDVQLTSTTVAGVDPETSVD